MVRFPKHSPTIFTAALAVVAFVGCASPQTTFEPRSDIADSIMTIYTLVIVLASIVGFAVFVAMAWLLLKFRARDGVPARQIHGNNKLELAWTIAPILVLVAITLPTLFWIAGTANDQEPDALEIRAIGHQWWFEYQYPGIGPDGGPLITANELHVPIGRQVSITLESDDVIHSFWVPQLVGKTDMIPGRINKLHNFTPNEIGVFFGQCVEFCGSAHALMRFRVHVDSTANFNAWVAGFSAPPSTPAPGSAEARGQAMFAGCSGCHAIAGTAAQGRVGPDLSLFGERLTLAAGVIDNTDSNLRQWIGDVRSIKTIPELGRFMPTFKGTLSDGEIADIAAYLKSLTLN